MIKYILMQQMNATNHRYSLDRKYILEEQPYSKSTIWIPKARSSTIHNINPKISGSTKYEWGEIYVWTTKSLFKLYPFTVNINEEVNCMPTEPPTSDDFINKCLRFNEPLCTPLNEAHKKLNEININPELNNNPSLVVNSIVKYLSKNMIYEYPPKTRDAESVAVTMKSDCGGYHSLFVTLMRILKIPAVMDFGARLPGCTPHVWAWWFDMHNKKWNIIDINDIQNNIPLSHRVSFTLGTGLNDFGYPRKVVFLQNSLVWDWNYDLHKKYFSKTVKVNVLIDAKLR